MIAYKSQNLNVHMHYKNFKTLNTNVIQCHKCPRLVIWRETVALKKKPSFKNDIYWGKPVPGFGDQDARVLVVGLAPAAHGGNRTGRIFTGDRSGEWLFRSLFETGFANQPESYAIDDGLILKDIYITAIVKCAPPQNLPTSYEQTNCNHWLQNELALLTNLKIIVTLGQIAFKQVLLHTPTQHWKTMKPIPKFQHGLEIKLPPKNIILISSYHPSQQNTFTGKLTKVMFNGIFERVNELL